MDRREFLRRAMSLAPALVVVPPAVSYFLPPRGGWPIDDLIQRMIDADMRQALAHSYNAMMLKMFDPPLVLAEQPWPRGERVVIRTGLPASLSLRSA